jgi:coenzyme F420-reducing hydrogenase delta subunit/formate hydrogenlyase subunit 6/NADH:ubiquinone oxidoreductase subunit I
MNEPKIVAFLCTWCSYTGADTAGIARLKSPANLRAIRVPCSGRVSPELIMRAFDQGADGVLVLGCHIGECHYDSGNHRAAKRVPTLKALLTFAGLEPERLRLDWVSASEGERFSRITTDFVNTVRSLGPINWRVAPEKVLALSRQFASAESVPYPENDCASKTDAIRAKAKELLASGEISCVIGYEISPRGHTRPAFIYHDDDVERLVWNPDCSHNLTTYLPDKVSMSGALMAAHRKEPPKPVAVVVKPCDARAVNVMLAENRFPREKVHVIGMTCEGVVNSRWSSVSSEQLLDNLSLQSRCVTCIERIPVIYDTLIGEPVTLNVESRKSDIIESVEALEKLSPTERMEYWLSQFDRCIRCYACRQACPMCKCPTCLYERDDSTWVGLGIGVNQKRTFHLGRAYHLAGRCVGCDQCERACPMNIPINLLNQCLAQEVEKSFGHRAGMQIIPSPVVTVLAGEYKES